MMFNLAVLTVSIALLGLPGVSALGPLPNQIKNLVTFGDSYTDVVITGDGGIAWPVYAAEDGNFKLFPFARSGATCSNNLTFRPFPSLFESQLPLYFTEKNNGSLRLDPEETIYTLWIGTNDMGASAILTGDQEPGVTAVDVVSCSINWVTTLYQSGARNFLFQNMIPLQNTILYSADSYPNRYWTLQRNTTMWSDTMNELVRTGNQISKMMLQALPATHPGAHIGLFDSHSLFEDILADPRKFLNGTVAPNTTGAIRSCVFQENENPDDPGNCTVVTGSAVDSYLWFDELHPSEQTDRVVAREIAAAIRGSSSKYATWFS
ncbi:hypothetical protein NM688_g5746 [Phlebia brevispora]|uniref:Uncharacterized protein n=1 Tax=Phlebia brevispora TaxID=194682 RepID=A0ACC1SQJ2_9APHY|nr:hypothetical protein NM688_g5746 [Phlebia brevispora]